MIPLKGHTFFENDRREAFEHGVKVVNSVYQYPLEGLEAFRRKLEKDGASAIEVLNKAPHLFPYFFKMDALEYTGVSAQEVVTIVTEKWIEKTKGFRSENPDRMPFVYWHLNGCYTHPAATSTKVVVSEIRPTIEPLGEVEDSDRGFDLFGEA